MPGEMTIRSLKCRSSRNSLPEWKHTDFEVWPISHNDVQLAVKEVQRREEKPHTDVMVNESAAS